MATQKNEKSIVRVLAHIEEMSSSRVLEMIGREKYQAILDSDQHPMFVELIAGHEGWSVGRLLTGRGQKQPARKKWNRERISELVKRLCPGVPVFQGHSSSRSPRRPIGEMVSSAERWIRGILGAAGIAYISDPAARRKIRDGELDTCSIEAEVECHRSPDGNEQSWVVDAVRKVSGIALGSSRLIRPGFAGAALLAAVEEFGQGLEDDGTGGLASDDEKADADRPALDGGPSRFFSREALLDDPVVVEMISACRERDSERIAQLSERVQAKDRAISALSAELERKKAEEKERTRVTLAEMEAERILTGRNLSREEREIILDEIRKRPPGQDGEEGVEARVERELQKINRLRGLLARERIATPPERERPPEKSGNPLIPQPRA